MNDIKVPPRRIISLTPSITETLFALGVEDRVVGVTDTCDYPEAVLEKPNVACWFEPNMDKLTALKPDLVIGAASAHLQLKKNLEKLGINTLLTDPASIDDVLGIIEDLGAALGVEEQAIELKGNLKNRLDILDAEVGKIPGEQRLTTCRILEWNEGKVYVAGPKSFQYDIIARSGGLNITGGIGEAYPQVSVEQLQAWDPEVIFFCGYSKDFIIGVLGHSSSSLRAIESGRLFQFDCNLTCRNGPRIVDMAELLHKAIYHN